MIAKRQEGAQLPTDSAGFHAFVLSVVNELVEEELLLQKAKELKVEVPDADVNNTVDKQIKDIRSRFGSEAEYRNELRKAGLGTPEEYRRFRADQVRRNEPISRTVKQLREDGKIISANVTDADVRGGVRAQQGLAAEARAERRVAPDHHRAEADGGGQGRGAREGRLAARRDQGGRRLRAHREARVDDPGSKAERR